MLKKKNKIYKVIVFNDTHFPDQDKKAVELLLKFIKKERPDEIVCLGDLIEMESVSKWPKNKPQIYYLKNEFAVTNKFLDQLQKVSGKAKIVYLEGNHELFLRKYINNKCPELAGVFDLETGLRLEERGIEFIEYEKFYSIGHLVFFHGYFCNTHHAKKHVSNFGCNVMYGHSHCRQVYSVSSFGKPHRAESMGCLCIKDKPFLKGKPNNWNLGFGIVYFKPNGTYNSYFMEIIDGSFISPGGKLYE